MPKFYRTLILVVFIVFFVFLSPGAAQAGFFSDLFSQIKRVSISFNRLFASGPEIAFVSSGQAVDSVECGQEFTIQGNSYPDNQAWVYQTKDNVFRYEGILPIPLNYKTICDKDEGEYKSEFYTIVNGKKGELVNSKKFQILEKTPVTKTLISFMAENKLPLTGVFLRTKYLNTERKNQNKEIFFDESQKVGIFEEGVGKLFMPLFLGDRFKTRSTWVPIGNAKLSSDENGNFTGKNEFVFVDPDSKKVIEVFQDLDVEQMRGSVEISDDEGLISIEFKEGEAETMAAEMIVYDKNKNQVAKWIFKTASVIENGTVAQLLTLMYDENGNLISYAEKDLMDILDDLSGSYYDPILEGLNGFEEPYTYLIFKYGSESQKRELVKNKKIVREFSPSRLFKIIGFENKVVGVFQGQKLVLVYFHDNNLPIYVSKLSDGTFEIIFENGSSVIFSSDFKNILSKSGPQANVSAPAGSPLKRMIGDLPVSIIGKSGNPEGFLFTDPKTRNSYIYDSKGDLTGMVIRETGAFVPLSPVYEKDANGDVVKDLNGKPVIKGYDAQNGWPDGNNPFDASNKGIYLPGVGGYQPGQKGYITVNANGTVAWVPYEQPVHPIKQPRAVGTPINKSNKLKSAEIIPIGNANLLNLKNGDKYKLRVLGTGGPLTGKVKAGWFIPDSNPLYSYLGKKQEIEYEYNLNSQGEIEFNVTADTPSGEYELKYVKYNDQIVNLNKTLKIGSARLRGNLPGRG